MSRPIVLASTSPYRARLLRDLGIEFTAVSPSFDERAFDHRFAEVGPETLAVELATGKARSVLEVLDPERADALVIGGDQLAVLGWGSDLELLHRPPDHAAAVAQLMRMAGTRHRLFNGLVVMDAATGVAHHEIDVQVVTMRGFTEIEAARYVEEFEPFDCAGGYRLEDDADLVDGVEGEDPSGVMGLPLPALFRLLARHGEGRFTGGVTRG